MENPPTKKTKQNKFPMKLKNNNDNKNIFCLNLHPFILPVLGEHQKHLLPSSLIAKMKHLLDVVCKIEKCACATATGENINSPAKNV